MSVLHINQIGNKIKDIFEGKINIEDLNQSDSSIEDKLLTRYLAAYAIYSSTECSAEDAGNAVVDGANDNGIDAIYYNQASKKMIIVQSKWSKNGKGEPDSASIHKFCTGIKDLFNTKFDRFNDKVQSKKFLIETALTEYDTTYEIILIDTYVSNVLAEHAQRPLEDLITEMNDTGDENQVQIVNFKRMNQGKVFSSLANSSGNDPIDIELGLMQWGMVSEPYKAFYGMVSGDEISAWWENYKTKLFEKNIRQVLGNTDVNDEIKKTLSLNQESFWYFNNGITMICDSIEKSKLGGGSKDFGQFKLKNVAIVNGAQTVSTIGKFLEARSEASLDAVKVHLRIISLNETPEKFGEEVTRTNNRQNKIENRDFVSQDPEQLRIKTELSIESIDYSIMRSETFKVSDKSFDLNEATISLVCANDKTSLTVQVKRGIGKFYENLEKGIYKEIFNRSIPGIYVYNCVKVNRIIENKLYKEIQNLPKKSGRKYGLLVHGNRIISQLTFYFLDLKQELMEIKFEPDVEHIESKIDQIIERIENKLEKEYPDNLLGTLFKNSTKCDFLVQEIKKETI